jgi:hypothetical protein
MKMVMEWVIALSLTAVRFGELMRIYDFAVLWCSWEEGRLLESIIP